MKGELTMHKFKVGDRVEISGTKYGIGTICEIIDSGTCFISFDNGYQYGCKPSHLRLQNPPLTIADLEKMDGERVWVENIDKDYSEYNGWHKIDSKLKKLYQSSGHLMTYSFDYEYIKIYRHKPERIDNMEMPELKTGMVVERKNGHQYLVMRDSVHGDIAIGYNLPGYNFLEKIQCPDCEEYKIVKIYEISREDLRGKCSLNRIWPIPLKFTPSQAAAKLSELLGEDVEIV